jgi:zinc ribbon protein
MACSACGAQLLQGQQFCSACGRQVTAFAVPKKRMSGCSVALLIVFGLVAGIVVLGYIVGSIALSHYSSQQSPPVGIVHSSANQPKQSSAVSSVRPSTIQPTQEELAKARRAGLSKEFAIDAWQTHIYTVNTYTRLAGLGTDGGLVIPSDEAIRDGLKATKKSVHTAADQMAFDRMYALLWIDHTAPHFKMKGENSAYEGQHDAGYGKYVLAGEDCFSAVMSSFGDPSFSDYPPDVQKGIRNCLKEQRNLKAAIDRVRIVKWDEF